MGYFLRKLRPSIWISPGRRWWGLEVIPFIGFAVGSWYWTVEGRLVTGILVLAGSLIVEAAIFNLFIKKRRASGP